MAKKSSKKSAKQGINPDILFIIDVVVAVLLFISNIGFGGGIGSTVSNIFFGLMGLVSFIFPFFLIFFSFYYLFLLPARKHNPRAGDYVLSVLLFLGLCLLTELILVAVTGVVNDPIEAFETGRDQHAGGGIFGGTLSYVIIMAFGKAGAWVIDLALIILSGFLLTGISLFGWFSNKSSNKIDKKKSGKKGDKRKSTPRVEREGLKNKEKKEPRIRIPSEYDKSENDYKDYEADDDFYIGEDEFEKNGSQPAFNQNNEAVKEFDREPNVPVVNTEPGPSLRDTFASTESDKTSRLENVVRGIDFGAVDGSHGTPMQVEPEPVNISHIENLNKPAFDTVQEVDKVSIKPVGFTENVPEPLPMPESFNSESDTDSENNDTNVSTINESVPVEHVFVEPEPIENTESIEESVILEASEPNSESDSYEYDEVKTETDITDYSVKTEPFVSQEDKDSIYVNEEPVSVDTIETIDTLDSEDSEVFKESENTEETETVTDEENIEDDEEEKPYVFPPVSLLSPISHNGNGSDSENLNETADKLVNTLMNFGVEVTISEISKGPAVTRFELIPKMGVKVSKIINLSDDIKLNLAAADIRIEAPIPGKSAVGIEVPNKNVEMVHFRELIECSAFTDHKSPIAFGAGKDLGGNIVISDIAKMPHVLIAGATGSGKSVCINTIIMSILYKADPKEVRFIMIDPKVVELSVYNGIPHLLIPVVSDPKKAAGALQWVVREMDNRYKKFAELGVRDLMGYNKKAEEFLPQIVVIVDELADLMMVAGNEVEESICRLAQLARACGIHLVIATQRPSVNVITGLIKANMPSRIAFAVTSGVDSRTILDMNGAEKLLGKGDMLYFPQGNAKPVRVQGAFVSDDEVFDVVDFIKTNNTPAKSSLAKQAEIESQMSTSESGGGSNSMSGPVEEGRDDYFEACGRLIIEKEKGSIGMLQRNFKIGFNRAARIMDQLAEAGVVGPEEGTKPRKVLVTLEQFAEIVKEGS